MSPLVRIKAARRVLASVILLLAGSSVARAQEADLHGVVTDPSGGVVPAASVTVTLVATGFRQVRTTDAVGRFAFPFLTPGRYDVLVAREGFQTIIRPDVILDAGTDVELALVVTPARVEETVDVTADAMPIDETQGGGLTIDRDYLSNIPLNGRTLQPLILMTPGVVGTFDDGQFSVEGMRSTSNAFTIDGVSANVGVSRGNNQPRSFGRNRIAGDTDTNAGGANPAFNGFGGSNDIVQLESIDQIRIQSSPVSAQYGRQPGAQIQVVTRSGSNRFTATAFEYFRDSALDARDWFSNANPRAAREPLEHHQFGGVLGGPIVRNRAFFFLSYEGLRSRQPGAVQQRMVPAERLRGDRRLSPVLRQLLDAYPAPQGAEFTDSQGRPTGAAPFYDAPMIRRRSNAYSVKIDNSFGPRLQLSTRWNQGLSGRTGLILAQRTSNDSDIRTLTVNGRSVLGTRVLNDFSANYSGNIADTSVALTDRFETVPIDVRDLVPASAPASAMATVSLPGNIYDYGLGPSIANRQRQVNVVDSVSWSAGRHGFRFGADLRRLMPTYGPSEYRTTVTFNSVNTLLQNTANQLSILSADQVRLRVVNFSAYAQDTFRLNGRLTLDYGTRWEVNPAPAGADKPLYTLDGFPDVRALRLAAAGTPLYATRWNRIAPRIGIAYRLRQSSRRTSIVRGSYGLFFDLGTGATATAARMFPYNRTTRRSTVPFPLSEAAAEPAPPLSLDPPYTGQDFTIVAPGNTLPRTHRWSASFQQAFGRLDTVTATYTANIGRALLRRYFYAFDAANPLNPAFPSARLNITRNDPGWGDSSNYHALQVQYVRRLSRGLQALVNYALARATDTGSDDSMVNLVNNATSPTFYQGYGRSDRRHTFNAAITYNVPAWSRLRALFSGWSTDYNVRVQSAAPLTVTYTYRDPVDQIDYTYRVDLVPGAAQWLEDATAPGGRRLNAAAFAVPASAFGAGSRNEVTHGNETRNAVRGFGSWQVDFVLRRRLPIKRRRSAELRAEFFNVFNNPTFAAPSASIGTLIGGTGQFIPAPLFGRATQTAGRGGMGGGLNATYAAGGARAIQLAVRVVF